MQRHLDAELDKLKNRIIKMCSLVDDQVKLAFKVFLSGNPEMVNDVAEMEEKIDSLDIKIDKFCHELVALGQPVAKDLRFILATMKIDNDLERIGDIAVGIANKTESTKSILSIMKKLRVDEYASFSEYMIKDAIDCFVNSDLALANQILRKVNDSEKRHQNIFENLVVEMMQNKDIVPAAIDLVLVLRHISRMCDHATNIAEEVIFLLEGKIVKHQKNLGI